MLFNAWNQDIEDQLEDLTPVYVESADGTQCEFGLHQTLVAQRDITINGVDVAAGSVGEITGLLYESRKICVTFPGAPEVKIAAPIKEAAEAFILVRHKLELERTLELVRSNMDLRAKIALLEEEKEMLLRPSWYQDSFIDI